MAILVWVLGLFLGPTLLGFIPSLIFYLSNRDNLGWRRDATREALNFQLSFTIYFFGCFVLIFALIGFLLLPVVGLLLLIFSILGAVKSSAGEIYRCPIAIRFLK
ncbi:MAG: DUF4870 domain-containing protein [Phycisphaerae bacterium]